MTSSGEDVPLYTTPVTDDMWYHIRVYPPPPIPLYVHIDDRRKNVKTKYVLFFLVIKKKKFNVSPSRSGPGPSSGSGNSLHRTVVDVPSAAAVEVFVVLGFLASFFYRN